MVKPKQVLQIAGPGSTHWVGDGFPVRNLFPSNGISAGVNPFIMLDYVGPAEFPPSDVPPGVDEHPHRGFETVTIAYQGSVEHRDSAGNSGVIHPGDVQWMTAASGVVHEEKHEREFARRGGAFEMVQLWVNLPAAEKMSKPRYQAITTQQIPVVRLGQGATARIIAGSCDGTAGPARTVTPLNVWDMSLQAGAQCDLTIPHGHNAAIVLLQGSGCSVNGSRLESEAKIAVLSPEGESVALQAETTATMLLLSGQPINEPVASYGPFVMNTPDEIRQAIQDYRSGLMGRLSN